MTFAGKINEYERPHLTRTDISTQQLQPRR